MKTRTVLENFLSFVRRKPIELWPFLLLVVVLKWEMLFFPFFWDELVVYSYAAHWLNQNGLYRALPGLHEPGLFFGHSPGFSFLVGSAFRVFGENFFVARSLVLFLFLVQLFFLHRLILPFGRMAAILGVATYFAIPAVYSQSIQVLGDIGVASFGTVAIYYAFQRKVGLYAFFGVLAFLMKETALAIVVPVFALALFDYFNSSERRKTELFVASIPILFIGFYLVIHWFTTGKLTNFPMLYTLDLNVLAILERMLKYWYWHIVLYPGIRFVFPLSVLAVSFFFWSKHQEMKRFSLIVLGTCFCFLAGISLLNFINPRYFLPVFGPLCVLAGSVTVVFLQKKWIGSCMILFAFFLVLGEHGREKITVDYGGEANMQYKEIVALQLEAARYLEENHANKRIYAEWPIVHQLRDPFFGYVNKKMNLGDRQNYDIMVIASNSDLVGREFQKSQVTVDQLVLEKSFQKDGRWVEIWKKRDNR